MAYVPIPKDLKRVKTINISDIHTSIFKVLGYAILLGLMMLKSGTLAKSILNSH